MSEGQGVSLVLGAAGLKAGNVGEVLGESRGLFVGVDTAPYYSDGGALGILRPHKGLAITTRIPSRGNVWRDGVGHCYPIGELERSIKHQLMELRSTSVDCVLLESWNRDWPIDRIGTDLRHLRESGLCNRVGVSLPDSDPGAAECLARGKHIEVVQGDGSLIRRSFLLSCWQKYRSFGVSPSVRAPFFHGVLAERFDFTKAVADRSSKAQVFSHLGREQLERARDVYREAADDLGISLPVLALAFLFQLVGDAPVVVGVSSREQVRSLADRIPEAQAAARRQPLLDLIPDLRIGE